MTGSSLGTPVVEAHGISKRFGSILALHGVDIAICSGEVVGLVGDNGAGKSTLVKILSGEMEPTSGTVYVDGVPVHFRSPQEARRRGIETVYQDLALAPDLTVWANLFLGRERIVRGPMGVFGWLDRSAMVKEAQQDLERTKIRIGSASQVAGRLSGGQRQAVAVGRAVAWGSRVVLMDEPTAALGVEQQGQVGRIIRGIAETGTPVLLVSHNLPQVHRLCDRVLVLFQGQVIADVRPAESTIEELVSWITGAGLRRTQHVDN